MLRQRLTADVSRPALVVGRVLVLIVCLGLVLWGAAVAALALGVASRPVDLVTGYRTAFDALAGLAPDDVGGTVRIVAAVVGFLALLVLGRLALGALPRPHLARSGVELVRDQQGALSVAPRAVERAVECAALEHERVTGARALYGTTDLRLQVAATGAADVTETLSDVRDRAVEALGRAGLPALPVHTTLVRLDRTTSRELA